MCCEDLGQRGQTRGRFMYHNVGQDGERPMREAEIISTSVHYGCLRIRNI